MQCVHLTFFFSKNAKGRLIKTVRTYISYFVIFSLCTGHFTQVVWKKTESLGIAKAKSPKSGKIIVVANYEPAGNWIGQYKDNVPPLMQDN